MAKRWGDSLRAACGMWCESPQATGAIRITPMRGLWCKTPHSGTRVPHRNVSGFRESHEKSKKDREFRGIGSFMDDFLDFDVFSQPRHVFCMRFFCGPLIHVANLRAPVLSRE